MSDLQRVSEAVRLMESLGARVDDAKEQLRALKEQYDRVRMETVPELLREVGLTEVSFEDEAGQTVKVSLADEVDARISAKNETAAAAWLIERGFGGLLKTKLVVDYDADQLSEAAERAAELRNQNARVEVKQGVHPQTLKSFVKEQMAAGNEVPTEIFSIHAYSVAKIKRG